MSDKQTSPRLGLFVLVCFLFITMIYYVVVVVVSRIAVTADILIKLIS